MADNSLNAAFGAPHQEEVISNKSTLNKNSIEFKPIFAGRALAQPTGSDEEYFSTVGSVLDELLSKAAVKPDHVKCKYQETPTVSPMPSTAQTTPQLSSVYLPPPPGYDPIVEAESEYFDPSMYSSPSWRAYPPPFHLGHKLFVGALPYSVSEADLFPLFGQFGEILELHIQRDYVGRSTGCAWLRYSSVDECDAAIDSLHNNYYLGSMNRPMQLTYASDKTRARTGSYSVPSVNGEMEESGSRSRAMTEQLSASSGASSVLSQLRLLADSQQNSVAIVENDSPPKEPVTGGKRFQVTGFPPDFSDREVEDLFSQFGPIESLARTAPAAAVVDFQFTRDADRARSVMEGVTLPRCDAPLHVLLV